jgi:hypothetical protein
LRVRDARRASPNSKALGSTPSGQIPGEHGDEARAPVRGDHAVPSRPDAPIALDESPCPGVGLAAAPDAGDEVLGIARVLHTDSLSV